MPQRITLKEDGAGRGRDRESRGQREGGQRQEKGRAGRGRVRIQEKNFVVLTPLIKDEPFS